MPELNLVFTVLCQHCGTPLYGRVKFCPSCGKEESIALVAGAANARRALERETTDPAEAQALATLSPAAAPRHEVQEVVEIPAPPDADCKTTKVADSTSARFAPPLESPTERPAPPFAMPGPTATSPSGAVPKRPLTAKVAAMALVLLAMVPSTLYINQQNETAKLPQVTGNLAEAQGALDRADLTATLRAIGVLPAADPGDPGDPGVQKLSAETDRRVEEPSDLRAQPRTAASKATGGLELGAVPAQAPSAVDDPASIVALPWLRDTADPKETTCDQALAALTLCPNERMPGTGPGGVKP